jgi:hypothetical protein
MGLELTEGSNKLLLEGTTIGLPAQRSVAALGIVLVTSFRKVADELHIVGGTYWRICTMILTQSLAAG